MTSFGGHSMMKKPVLRRRPSLLGNLQVTSSFSNLLSTIP